MLYLTYNGTVMNGIIVYIERQEHQNRRGPPMLPKHKEELSGRPPPDRI